MKVSVDEQSSVKKNLNIEIPNEDVVRELDAAYDHLKKTAKVKGFRPGKVPRTVLERRFRKDVHADVASKLIQSSFLEAVREKELKIVGNPEIDPPELKADAPYAYQAVVEVHPEIGNIEISGLKLKKTRYTASDEEMEAQLQMIRKNLAERKAVTEDRPLGKDDFAVIDYEGTRNGKPFEETQKTENYILKVGAGTISPDFDENLVGLKTGDEKDFSVTFEEDHQNKNLAGVSVDFHVRLNEIREEILPELDDELARKVGPYETLDILKEAVSENLRKGYEKRSEQELNEQIFQGLIERTDFEVPDALVQMELEGILEEAERAFSFRDMAFEDAGFTREGLAEKYRETAEKQVRRHLILDQIIRQENLTVGDDELAKGLEEMSATTGQPVEVIQRFYKENKERMDMFKHTLLEKQAIRLIIGSSELEEVEPQREAPAQQQEGA
ncbi:MAG: trigger factor [Desulfobacteraceae bacterium]|nr:trigger factor [Desulfobacteraceae bacterium]